MIGGLVICLGRTDRIREAGGIAPTSAITVRSVTGEKFDCVTDYQLGPIPPRLDGSDEREAQSVSIGRSLSIPDDEIPV